MSVLDFIFGSNDDQSTADVHIGHWDSDVWTYDETENFSYNHDEDWGHYGPPVGYDEDE